MYMPKKKNPFKTNHPNTKSDFTPLYTKSQQLHIHTLQKKIGNQAVVSLYNNQPQHPMKTIQRSIDKSIKTDVSKAGYINYSFDWEATSPHINGYIVQKIKRIENDKTTEYWEAWWVDDKGNIKVSKDKEPLSVTHDSWTDLSTKWGEQGTLDMTGEVYFVAEGTDTCNTIDHWGISAVEMAGGLKSSMDAPNVGAPVASDHKNWAWNLTKKLQIN